jgi:hypothetical protein
MRKYRKQNGTVQEKFHPFSSLMQALSPEEQDVLLQYKVGVYIAAQKRKRPWKQ